MSPRDRIGEAIAAIVAPETGSMPRVSAADLNHQLLCAGLKAMGRKLSGAFYDEGVPGVKTMADMCVQLQEHMGAKSISDLKLRLSTAVDDWWDSSDTSECVTELVEKLVEKHIDTFVLDATEIVVALAKSKFVEDDGDDGEEEDDLSSESAESEEDLSAADDEGEEAGEDDDDEGDDDEDDDEDENEEDDAEDGDEEADAFSVVEFDDARSAKRSHDDDDDDAQGLVLSKRARA